MIQRMRAFFEESKQEFTRVNWPTFQETTRLTMFVVIFSIVTAIFLGILDGIFTYLLSKII